MNYFIAIVQADVPNLLLVLLTHRKQNRWIDIVDGDIKFGISQV
jgi:hypothetical protein